MVKRPRIPVATEFGNATSWWVEYPTGLIDVTRTTHLPKGPLSEGDVAQDQPTREVPIPPLVKEAQLDIPVDGERTVRIATKNSAVVIIDMQNFFLHPDLREHPTGLACVIPIMNTVLALRSHGVKILWVNWGLTEHELTTIPPSLVRGFKKGGHGGFGAELAGGFGRLLMRGEFNSDLYGPLQGLYEQGRDAGTDVWIHKNRMSGIWGGQTALDLYLQEQGISTLFFAGVNADQCVLGTLVDAYFRGYDCITVEDCTATTSPPGALESVIYNAGGSYGFVTDSERIIAAAEASS
ncbi:Isochorismatase hydrolase [Polyporus arcularius HHB13444]|uniref:Isochorismatase hydrolase n=1 Tax=Polyporus arcularius HHB13444 TaxID=1314778 RepID=A0A5C3PUI7_9APHY|nr:Isochorismatase hydrolase [Polyporus arcularius HHB13444]